ncbi:WD40-repeat-containing domain protein, partial [Mycena sp. CBHHK59/15]
AFSPDGKHIVSGSSDQTVRVWDAESGEALGAPFEGHTHWVTSVAFSPDGKHIVSGSNDRTIRVWDAESREVLRAPFEGHTDSVTSVAFSPNGKHIVSSSRDRTVRVWDAESGEALVAPFQGDRDQSRLVLLNTLRNKSPPVQLHWKIHQGWVSCRPSELLFWLPAPHRIGLWSPHNTLVIGKQPWYGVDGLLLQAVKSL